MLQRPQEIAHVQEFSSTYHTALNIPQTKTYSLYHSACTRASVSLIHNGITPSCTQVRKKGLTSPCPLTATPSQRAPSELLILVNEQPSPLLAQNHRTPKMCIMLNAHRPQASTRLLY